MKFGRSKSYNPDHYVDGDSIIQLSDGRILTYYFRDLNEITIYNKDTFKSILTIDLYDITKEEEKNLNFADNDGSKQNSIIEISNNLLLVGLYQFLIEIDLKEKTFEYKIVYQSTENILNFIQLTDKRIVLITRNNIEIINKEIKGYILKEKNNIEKNWKIKPASPDEYCYSFNFNQYYLSLEIPNNRLLLNSFSTELVHLGHCGTHPPDEISRSKIIFIDLNNFKIYKSTKIFKKDAKSIVLEKIIIIQAQEDIYIHDIISLDVIRQIPLENYYDYIYKYNNDYIIAFSEYEKRNNLLIYKVQGNNLLKNLVVKNTFGFNQNIGYNCYPIYRYNNKFVFTLKDKRLIILCNGAINLLNLEID